MGKHSDSLSVYRWRDALQLCQPDELVLLPLATPLGGLDVMHDAPLVVEDVIGKQICLARHNAWNEMHVALGFDFSDSLII